MISLDDTKCGGNRNNLNNYKDIDQIRGETDGLMNVRKQSYWPLCLCSVEMQFSKHERHYRLLMAISGRKSSFLWENVHAGDTFYLLSARSPGTL